MKIAINILASLLLSINITAQTTYYVKNGGNNNGGLDEVNAFSSVRNAMEVVSDGDKIIVTGPVSQSIQCGIYKSVTIEGQNGAEIMPLGNSRDRLFIVTSPGKTITFKNIIFKDVNTASYGGAIYLNHNSDLFIQDCSFINNSVDYSDGRGGAILAGATGNLTITNSLFKENSTLRGGAIHIAGSNRTFLIDKCTFIENYVDTYESNGGAISTYGENTSQSTIKNSTFFKNKAAGTFESTERGGSILIEKGGLLTIENCLFYENKVYQYNGDIYISDINVKDPYLAQLSLSNSIISAINGSTDTVDGISYSNTLIGADLSASNLRFDETLKKVIWDLVDEGIDSPEGFGSDGNDVGAWNFRETNAPKITLLGEAIINIQAGSNYEDLGATAIDNYDGDITENIITGGDTVNTNVLGTYIITYNVSDSSGYIADEVIRTVNVIDTTRPEITIIGGNNVTIEVGSTYEDLGASAIDNYDGDITENIIVSGDNVNTSVIGQYVTTYSVSDSLGNTSQVSRTINVVDTTAPTITLIGDTVITLELNSTYTEQGATAYDNYDGDVSEDIIIGGDTVNTGVVGQYSIIYSVSDSLGNTSQVNRTINVEDTTAPTITLIGDTVITLELNSTYTEQGATANDNYDGNISENIVIGGDTVNTNIAGQYIITYSVSDSSGNTTQVNRIINVIRKLDLIGVVDFSSTEGYIRGFHLEVLEDITDLSYYSYRIASNGSSFNNFVDLLPKISVKAGDHILLVGGDQLRINKANSYINASVIFDVVTNTYWNGNGNDALMLEFNGYVIETFGNSEGNPDTSGVGCQGDPNCWDYEDAWAYKVNGEWIYGEVDCTDNTSTIWESSCVYPFAIGKNPDDIDVTAPIITLIGDSEITIELEANYIDEGAFGFDDRDGDISANIITINTVDTNILGTYYVTYNLNDAAGNSATEVIRTVNVIDSSLSNYDSSNHKRNIQIYPNPASDYIKISNTTQTKPYTIFNLTGQEITNGNINSESKISVQHLKAGIYFLIIDKVKILKLIID